MKVIDTDILIDHFHGNQSARDYLAEALATGEELAISVITLAEFTAGMRVGEEDKTERLLALFRLDVIRNN
jgi:predicted nucleic acid-binding protein